MEARRAFQEAAKEKRVRCGFALHALPSRTFLHAPLPLTHLSRTEQAEIAGAVAHARRESQAQLEQVQHEIVERKERAQALRSRIEARPSCACPTG
jgi:hypothetical protein